MMKIVEVTPGVMAAIKKLKNGDKITVTHKENETLYEITGGGRQK